MGFMDHLMDLNFDGKFNCVDLWLFRQLIEYAEKEDQEERELEEYLSRINIDGSLSDSDWDRDPMLCSEEEFAEDIHCAAEYNVAVKPEKYPAIVELSKASEDSKYGWRKECLRNPEYGVFPEKYETEREYYHAYLMAQKRYYDFAAYQTEVQQQKPEEKCEWRKYCVRNPEYGISPEDCENRMDYYREYLARKRLNEDSKK